MNAKQILLDAAAMVEKDPTTFTTGVAARDAGGRAIAPNDPRATCWCAIGFVLKGFKDDSEGAEPREKALDALRSTLTPKGGNYSIPHYSDSLSPLEFVEWSRKAAALCE